MPDLDDLTNAAMDEAETPVSTMPEEHVGPIRRFLRKSNEYINYKVGAVTGAGMSAIVFGINYYMKAHELIESSIAGLKQYGYTFLMGGLFTRLCEYLGERIENRTVARAVAITVPSALTITATYLVHLWLKKSPEPFLSTMPTIMIAPPAFAYWNYRTMPRAAPS